MTTSSTSSLVEFGKKHVTKGLGRVAEGIMSTGRGSYVTFEDGRQMLDFTCGIGVTGLGQHVSIVVPLSLLSDYDVVYRIQDIVIRK
jgi:acetylornithine/succinyldiaminopimelate/putrescine aminotransferase